MEDILQDDRFSKIATDQRFRGGSKKQKKVKIDKRFQSMFADERFVSKCSVDKRGRPQNFSSKENYRKYYEMDDESDSQDDKEPAESPDEDSDSKLSEEESPADDSNSKSFGDDHECAPLEDFPVESYIKVCKILMMLWQGYVL